jgi:sodium transport system permease protein
MNWEIIRVLWAHELRLLLRDRRTLVVAIVLPLIIMPISLSAGRIVNERREKKLEAMHYTYAVRGTDAAAARRLVSAGRVAVEKAPADDKSLSALRSFKAEEVQVADAAKALRARDIHFYIEALTGAEADAAPPEIRQKDQPEEDTDTGPGSRESDAPKTTRLPGVPLVRVYMQGDQDSSRNGASRMRELLQAAQHAGRDNLLRESGFPGDPSDVFHIDESNVASTAQMSGTWVGRFLTLFLVMFILGGGAIAAMDIVAGEKERGSLETILTTAARRSEIVSAKQLAILTVAAASTVIQVANILVYVTFRVIPLPKGFVIEAPPGTVVLLLALFLPVAALISAALLMLSAYAKSYKEAQSYFFPLYLLTLIPALAAVLPGVQLRSAIAVVPIANVSVAVREIMVGRFDWPMLALAFMATTASAAWMIRQSARILSNERLITASDSDAADLAGGPALFPRHVLRWYAVMAAVMFGVAANVPELATFRRQLLFNELVIFVAAPLLMIWRYRLRPAEAFSFRRVRPVAWLAVLLLIPAGNLTGVGVFRLANFVFPVPQEALEQFSRALVPKDVPVWQLYLFVALLPGICEELAFRGTLLYGLRRKLRPAGLVVTVGLIFGLFHIALFRILPTGFLGMVLTAVALLTGSIFPCMIAHAGNNALGLWMGLAGYNVGGLDWWAYVLAACVMFLALYIIYRVRTPYPELRR